MGRLTIESGTRNLAVQYLTNTTRIVTLSDYISDIVNHHRGGRGYVGFNHTPNDALALGRALEKNQIPYHLFSCKKLLQGNVNNPADIEHGIIVQDLPVSALRPKLEMLLNQVMLPLQLRCKPISFFSVVARNDYDQPISSEALHDEFDRIWNGLLLEQLSLLLESGNDLLGKVALGERKPTPFALDEDLDDSQKAAIAHKLGPIRVLAPAGSGKTKTLTNRIIHLINEGVKPETILALAFNKKAADEMMQRLQARGITVARRLHLPGVVVRTFHGLGYELIRHELGWQFDGETEQERLRALLQQAMAKHYRPQQRRNQDPLDPFLVAVNICKMDLAPLADFVVEADEDSVPFAPIFQDLLQLQWRKKFCTFDDMIYLAVRLLLDRAALRRRMQSRFHFLLIDEFQDLNRAQILMMQILSLPQNNLFVVGDDDQMIYGWRGADIRHILEFPERYRGAADCTLSTNYRSTQAIVRHSRWLIEHNQRRVFKDISPTPSAPAGQVEIRLADSLWQQAKLLADWIAQEQQKRQEPWEDYAVLFRYHAYKYVIAILLDAAGLPHTPVDGYSLAQTVVGRDALAYLTVILWPEKATREHLARVLKRPNKYFTTHFIHSIQTYQDLEEASLSSDLPEWAQTNLEDFLSDIHFMRQHAKRNRAPAAFLNTMASVFNLRQFYNTQIKRYAPLDEAGLDVLLDVLIAVAEAFATIEDFYQYLTKSSQTTAQATMVPQQQQGIVLSTIHAAKGREFRHVALFNLSENYRQDGLDDIEEERRVAYVGLTRGSQQVFITAPTKSPSPFLYELALNPQFKNMADTPLRKQMEKLVRETEKLQHTYAILTSKLKDYYEQQKKTQQPEVTSKPLTRLQAKIEKEKIKLAKVQNQLSSEQAELKVLQRELFFRQLLLRKGN